VNGVFSYLGSDGLGSATVALDASGNTQASTLYGPYGASRYANGTMPGSYGYTGQRADSTTGLDYYIARYYDPTAGQFISADTADAGLNRYAYVAGNPVTRTDPSGHDWFSSLVSTVATTARAVAPIASTVLDATTGIPSMISDVQTLFDPKKSLLEKVLAGGDLALNVVMDVTMVIGVGEGMRTAYMGLKVAAHVGEDVAVHVGEDAAAHAAEHAAEHAMEDAAEHAAEDEAQHAAEDACKLSFAPATLVATPSGEQAIGTLKVGDPVTAYDPTTKQTSTQTVQHVWINHDTDLIDLTLHTDQMRPTQEAPKPQQRVDGERQSRAPPQGAVATATLSTPRLGQNEVVHTTAKHPFLTAERGWVPAGQLTMGLHVVREDGSTAVVLRERVVPGAAAMYNLTVSHVHTYAVGTGQYVVHNTNDEPCDPTSTLKPGPYADKSIDARGPKSSYPKFSNEEREEIDAIGHETGCHTCGTKDPGARHFTPDHQPPDRLNPDGAPQRLYPHCSHCSHVQGGQL
jgi:RHS repeat-associated protein